MLWISIYNTDHEFWKFVCLGVKKRWLHGLSFSLGGFWYCISPLASPRAFLLAQKFYQEETMDALLLPLDTWGNADRNQIHGFFWELLSYFYVKGRWKKCFCFVWTNVNGIKPLYTYRWPQLKENKRILFILPSYTKVFLHLYKKIVELARENL